MIVITIANQKGGTGKTTTALCLGAELEQMGYKVLYIDLDKQTDASRTLRADLHKPGAYEILAEKTPANEVIQITENGHHVIAGNDRLANIDALLNEPRNQIGKEYRLKESLETVAKHYDFAVIDTPTGLTQATINALTCTDYLVVSSMADTYSADQLTTLLNSTDVIRRYTNNKLKTAGVLLTRYNNRSNISRAFKDEIERIAKENNTKVFNTTVRQNIAISECQALREPITTYAPNSNGHQDYKDFTEELLKDMGQ